MESFYITKNPTNFFKMFLYITENYLYYLNMTTRNNKQCCFWSVEHYRTAVWGSSENLGGPRKFRFRDDPL